MFRRKLIVFLWIILLLFYIYTWISNSFMKRNEKEWDQTLCKIYSEQAKSEVDKFKTIKLKSNNKSEVVGMFESASDELTTIQLEGNNDRYLSVNKKSETLTKNERQLVRSTKIRRPVYFLKTHKTGSSTIQNILMRYADRYNLTLALPAHKLYHFDYYHAFEKDFVIPLLSPAGEYDVMCHHMIYGNVVKEIMPRDTYFFTILREPTKQYVSNYNYFGHGGAECNRTVNEYVEKSIPDDVPLNSNFKPIYSNYSKCGNGIWLRHNTLYDTGMSYAKIDDKSELGNIINTIEENFDFVMILEYFDECLVMMKDQLGWSFEDILYFSQNARPTDKALTYLSEKSKAKLKTFLYQEYTVYEYFKAIFWRKVEAYDRERLENDVKEFRNLKSKFEASCIEMTAQGKDIEDGLLKPCCEGVNGFVLKSEKARDWMCRRLAATEWPYTELMRNKMVLDKKIHEKYYINTLKFGF